MTLTQRAPGSILAVMALVIAGCATDDDTQHNRQRIDLIVYADQLLSMVDGAPPTTDQAVAIDDGVIVALGPRDAIDRRYDATERLSGEGRAVLPGLVNGHTHAAMSLLRGIADDLELMEWLTNYIFPAEVELVDAHFVRVGTTLACWEMIRGGTTTFVDMYYFPDAMAESTRDCGLRAVVVPSVIEQTSPDASNGEESLAQAVDFVRRWQGRESRITPAIGAHSVYTLSRDALVRIREAANALKAPISIHVSESPFEIATTNEQYAMTPVALLEQLGFFSDTLIAAHMVYPTPDDIRILARHGVGTIHNPTSNMKLSSGISPVFKMLEAGVAVGLGTDGAASNNDLDMWEEIRLSALLSKVSTMDPTALPAMQVLHMATLGGAQAVGLDQHVGSLAVGKRADLIQVAIDDLTATPLYDIASHLVYVADEHDVVTTIVDGRVLMRERDIKSIDSRELRDEVAALQAVIAQRLRRGNQNPSQAADKNERP